MAKASSLLPDCTNVLKVTDGSYEIRVDGVAVAFLLGGRESGNRWEERAEIGAQQRMDATDAVLAVLVEQGEIDPAAPARDLRAEAVIPDQVKQAVRQRGRGICQYCWI